MTKYILLTFFFTSFFSWSQDNYIIKDNEGKIIPYASIYHQQKRSYSNSEGKFSLDDYDDLNDTLTFEASGYEKLIKPINDIERIIYLKKKTNLLEEVIITSTKKELVTIKPRRKARVFSNVLLGDGRELFNVIKPNDKIDGKVLKTITIYAAKSRGRNRKDHPSYFQSHRALLRLNFYSDTINFNKTYTSEVKKVEINDKSEVTFNVENKNIKFIAGKPLYVGVEFIGIESSDSKKIEGKASMNFQLTDKDNRSYSSKLFHLYNGKKTPHLPEDDMGRKMKMSYLRFKLEVY